MDGIASGAITAGGVSIWTDRYRHPVGRRRVQNRISVHFQGAIDEVHDPVVLNSGPRVQTALGLAVEVKARIRHFHGKRGPGGSMALSTSSAAPRAVA